MFNYENFVVYGLKNIYHEFGEYEFKIILNPDKKISDFKALMNDSFGHKMKIDVHRWGRKIHFKFVVDDTVSDGVSMITIVLTDTEGNVNESKMKVWMVKP